MKKLNLIVGLLLFLSNKSFCQPIDNTKLCGKWITCKMVDSTAFGPIGLENIDSFTTSVRLISKRRIPDLKGIDLDTITNEEARYEIIKNFLTPLYDLFHGTWIEFHNDSTAVEHINRTNGSFANLNRTYEFDTKTSHLTFDKDSHREELLVRILSDDTMLLSFYSEGLNLLVRRTK